MRPGIFGLLGSHLAVGTGRRPTGDRPGAGGSTLRLPYRPGASPHRLYRTQLERSSSVLGCGAAWRSTRLGCIGPGRIAPGEGLGRRQRHSRFSRFRKDTNLLSPTLALEKLKHPAGLAQKARCLRGFCCPALEASSRVVGRAALSFSTQGAGERCGVPTESQKRTEETSVARAAEHPLADRTHIHMHKP